MQTGCARGRSKVRTLSTRAWLLGTRSPAAYSTVLDPRLVAILERHVGTQGVLRVRPGSDPGPSPIRRQSSAAQGWLVIGPGRRSTAARAVVHAGLIATAVLSLALEPVLTLHIALGLMFVGILAIHLGQRRRVSLRLLARLRAQPAPTTASARLAAADLVLLAVAAVMLASGLWDWLAGHPTRIRWHAISGVVLAGWLVLHTLRRRRRLLSSRIR